MILLVERKELKQKKAQWMICPLHVVEGIFLGAHMKLIILTRDFYTEHNQHEEILKKQDRPYACLTVKLDGILFAIPFRHHIKHRYAFHTLGDAGLDFTKAVVITEKRYIASDKPTIESKEYAIVKKEEQKIRYKFKSFLHQYRRAMKHRDNPRSAKLLKYSALQYFEDYL